jgi:diadenosine tetraphosphatase ApaH/serine/threonine PP2A family protein phosphatase
MVNAWMKTARDLLERGVPPDREEAAHMIRELSHQLSSQPNAVRIPNRDLIVIGDLHGEYTSLDTIMGDYLGGERHLVFLGDYADRGPEQVRTINTVIALSLLYPDRVTLLRGNHESREIAQVYGFYNAVNREYGRDLFREYCQLFETIPLAAYSESGIFCCHGGVPEGLESLDQLQSLDRFDENFRNDIAFQMVWNDPRHGDFSFRPNRRSSRARLYGRKAFDKFSENMGVTRMFRAHEVFASGYQTFFDGQLISVFSASYQGMAEPKIVLVDNHTRLDPRDIAT